MLTRFRAINSPPHFSLLVLCILFCLHITPIHGQTVDLSKPVGATAGEAGSNGVGVATYSIPVNIPSGVKGVQPGVSLSYSSQGAGNDIADMDGR